MPRRSFDTQVLPSPGLKDSPVLDLMCSQFVLTLTVRHAGRFNLRRDCNNLLALTARHLAWPPAVLARLRRYLALRCKAPITWVGRSLMCDLVAADVHVPALRAVTAMLSPRRRPGRPTGCRPWRWS